MIYKKLTVAVIFAVSVAVSLPLALLLSAPASAACSPSTNYGTVTESLTVPSSGTYRVWSRLKTATSTANSYLLEVDGGTCYTVGGANLAANTWTWVNYQNGNTSSPIDLVLAAGSHSFKLYGNAPSVEVDRLILATDTSCVPTGTGDNCVTITPTPSPTPTPTSSPTPSPTPTSTPTPTSSPTPSPTSSPTPTPSPTPAPLVGDLDGDHHVTGHDVALLLVNWNRTVTPNTGGDLDGNGLVNGHDVALMLVNWGR